MDHLETPPKKPRVREVLAGDSGSDEENGQHDTEEEVDAEYEGGGLTPPPCGGGKITFVPIQQHTDVMVVSGGLLDAGKLYVLKTKKIIGSGEYGCRVMWPIIVTSQEACRVLAGSPAFYSPIVL